MLQKTADDRAHADVVGQAGNADRQRAGAARDQVDLDAALAGPYQGLDQAVVGQRVHLHDDATGSTGGGGFAQRIQLGNQTLVQLRGRHPDAVQLGQLALARQVHKHMLDVLGQQGVGRQVADVGVQAGRGRVVVARGQMGVAPYLFALAPGDQHHLGVGLQADHTVNDLGTNRFQHFGPVDVGGLVKARLQLHNGCHFFTLPDGFLQQSHQRRTGTGAVNGLLDRQHRRVVNGFTQEGQHAVKALEGLVDQHVALLQALKERLPHRQLQRVAGGVGRKAQLGRFDPVHQFAQAHQVHRPMDAVQRRLGQVELAQQEVRQMLRATRRHLQPHRQAVMPVLQALAQGAAQVLDVFLVHRQFRMAGHAELREVPDMAANKQIGQVRADHAGERDKQPAPARHLGRQLDQPRQHTRHLDDGDVVVAAKGVRTIQVDDEIQRLVGNLRKRMGRVQTDGDQQRAYLLFEILADPMALRGIAFAVRNDLDAQRVESRHQFVVVQRVLAVHQRMGLFGQRQEAGG